MPRPGAISSCSRSLTGERQGSLLAAIDRTVTGAGGRLLAARLAAPLARAEPIRRRLDAVAGAGRRPGAARPSCAQALKGCPDLERAVSRLSLGRGGPRDLVAIRSGSRSPPAGSGRRLAEQRLAARRERPGDRRSRALWSTRLEAALVADPPFLARDGGFIAAGLPRGARPAADLRDQARRHIAALEARTQHETGIGSLKIRHNNLLGYYIEVTATHRAKVPAHFVQRQSMAGATRYSTAELAELESQIASAAERALTLELELFDELCQAVLAAADAIAETAQAIARLDVAAGLAELAAEQRYCRPEVDDGDAFEIRTGRHPVVEQALAREARALHRQRRAALRAASASGC